MRFMPSFTASSKLRQRRGKSGSFHCYECGSEQPYDRTDMHDYFVFCGVPVYSQGIVATEIRCNGCGRTFSGEVLRGMGEEQLNRLYLRLRQSLTGGEPIRSALSEVESLKLPVHQQKQLLRNVIGSSARKCPNCGSEYRAEVTTCRACHSALPDSVEIDFLQRAFLSTQRDASAAST